MDKVANLALEYCELKKYIETTKNRMNCIVGEISEMLQSSARTYSVHQNGPYKIRLCPEPSYRIDVSEVIDVLSPLGLATEVLRVDKDALDMLLYDRSNDLDATTIKRLLDAVQVESCGEVTVIEESGSPF